ncbi:MAG TPA: transglycosylase SLT domain-containing protein [Candidatus Acidoferrales bacterium]|nr:transglycosylase SLT domain-containing protein [Candidatus Acidoferrales bacterium]
MPIPQSTLITLARAAAVQHNLDPSLVCAVCEQESAWNPFAIRYEPGFLARYVAPLFTAGKISATEAYARSFSWGLMQVMGQVAREQNFGGPSLAELCDPQIGLEIGCRVLSSKLSAAKGDIAAALQHYNGGSNADYASQVQARQPRYL